MFNELRVKPLRILVIPKLTINSTTNLVVLSGSRAIDDINRGVDRASKEDQGAGDHDDVWLCYQRNRKLHAFGIRSIYKILQVLADLRRE